MEIRLVEPIHTGRARDVLFLCGTSQLTLLTLLPALPCVVYCGVSVLGEKTWWTGVFIGPK